MMEQPLHGDKDIPIAVIPTISIADVDEEHGQRALQHAASDLGFFYLRLDSRASMLAELQDMYALAAEYFLQPQHLKLADARSDIQVSQDLGYKSSTCDETFEISWDEMVAGQVLQLPPIMARQQKLLLSFSSACQEACMALLRGLARPLLGQHRAGQASETGLKFISEPALEKVGDVGDYRHTDAGTLTMLFYEAWGLQVLARESGIWAFIPPKEGCVVVNVADSLAKLSEGRFHSPVHRITQPLDGRAERYYLSYFLRPELAAKELMASMVA